MQLPRRLEGGCHQVRAAGAGADAGHEVHARAARAVQGGKTVMFRLTREVRFAINEGDDGQWGHPPTNSYGGYPSARGFCTYVVVRVTLMGELEAESQYLINIKQMDAVTRGFVQDFVKGFGLQRPSALLWELFGAFEEYWRE